MKRSTLLSMKIFEAREQNFKKLPILLKIAPDLSYEEKKDIAQVVTRTGKTIDGLIVSNTTITRPDHLKSENRAETVPICNPESDSTLSYAERAINSNHPVAKRLFSIMEEKKTNLCIAVDAKSSNELLELAKELGPHICLLKTHIDILDDFSEKVVCELSKLASTHNFLILEDRKFADIGNTVKHQYQNGVYKIQEWADLVTVHGIPGSGIIDALKSCQTGDNRACVLVAEMSSKGALTNDDYKESVFKMAEDNPDFVIGYVSQHRNTRAKNLIHMCPGVNIESKSDSLGQQYKMPEEAVANGADVIIVGRGICKASDVVACATDYKTRGFNAYLNRIS